MKIEVTGPAYSESIGPITVEPGNVGGTFQYPIPALVTPGSYTISAGRADGSEAPTQVTVTVPEPPPPPSAATILEPLNAARRLYPWFGPIRVRWDVVSHPDATYAVYLAAEQVCSFDGNDLVPGDVTSCGLVSSPGIGASDISVRELVESEPPALLASAQVTVEPHLAAPILSLSPGKFYPYVRDNYRDRATLDFSLNKAAGVIVLVRNARGRVVRRVSLGQLQDGSWVWNGRNQGGSLVPTGRYRITVEARSLGQVRRSVREVVVARGWRTLRGSKSFCGGCGPGQIAASPFCYIEFDWFYDGDIFLDCWGGAFAIATWRFRVPATAFNIRKTIVGEVMCCAPGGVVSIGQRTGPRTYVVAAGVSGLRSWDIRTVRIRFSYKVRI